MIAKNSDIILFFIATPPSIVFSENYMNPYNSLEFNQK